ncbi:MAG: type II secretion system protein [Gammaproteobacteria bacterium]|nr:type II secretion system protein [Gammaproteobacteria bacterium]
MKGPISRQSGFTLIEMVVVIVILGILAAIAVPRFVNLQGDARQSVMSGVNGAIQSASAMVHAQALARGLSAASGQTLTVEGLTVNLVFGYPEAESINELINLQPAANFTITETGTTSTIQPVGAVTPAECQVVYTEATSATVPPTISFNGTDPADC